MKGQAGDRVAFDFTLEEIEWELNEENIEEYSEDIDDYGVIVIRAFDEDGDFVTRIIADVDIADGLYDAMSEVEDIIDEYPEVKVYYTTRCKGVTCKSMCLSINLSKSKQEVFNI